MATLLKMLGSEGFKGDSKMSIMIDVPMGIPVILITNYPELYLESVPIEQRLMWIELKKGFRWINLDATQFKYMILITIDGLKRITEDDLKFWNYAKSLKFMDARHSDQVAELMLAINKLMGKNDT
jgi:hypothetical protein